MQPDPVLTLCDDAGVVLDEGDVFVKIVKINYGMGARNPVDEVNFYRRGAERDHVGPIPSSKVSCLIPHVFEERYVRCFCRPRDAAKRRAAEKAFVRWSELKLGVDPCPLTPSSKRKRTR